MFDFKHYQWYHWLVFTAFVISLYWFWALYLIVGLMVLGAFADTGRSKGSRSRARSTARASTRWRPRPFRAQRIKPYRAPRVKKPRRYKGRYLKNGTLSTYDPVRKQWRNQARHSSWRPPPD